MKAERIIEEIRKTIRRIKTTIMVVIIGIVLVLVEEKSKDMRELCDYLAFLLCKLPGESSHVGPTLAEGTLGTWLNKMIMGLLWTAPVCEPPQRSKDLIGGPWELPGRIRPY